ncbi:MAG: OsmC family protein [Gemmatimonadota bacterium]|nr:OsmC family protein [Gemmatimonadota bacterium]
MATIKAHLERGTHVRISTRGHEWSADEPIDQGGSNTGPTPYEILLGSLAACTCVTLALYCHHKGIRLDAVDTEYEHDRIHARDCEECEDDRTGFIDRIQSRVRISGDLDDAQRARLEQIVGRCPVHKTLENPTILRDEVTFA